MYTKNALNKHKATFILTEGIALIIHPFQRLSKFDMYECEEITRTGH